MRIIKFLILLIIIVAIFFVAKFFYQVYKKPAVDQVAEIEFEIYENQGVNDIAYNLKSQGLISNILDFEIYIYITKKTSGFKVGHYTLANDMNVKQIVQTLTSEPESREVSITVIEGWTINDIAKKLQELEICPEDDFMFEVSQDYSQKFKFLKDKPDDINLEGYLFPDTYRFFKDSIASEVVKKMLTNFDNKFTVDLIDEVEFQEKTIFEIITLASILEKEVQTYEDKKIVAGLFNSRIENNIALGADSTINYITGKNKARSSLDDLEIDSPYNTYKNKGLPVGPISNPGLDSIKAAIYPTETDYLYFLTTDDGEVIYSETFDEHVKNKSIYLN